MRSLEKQGTSQLGHANSLAVFNEVLFDAPVPRADIAKRTKLTATSVSRITRQLIEAGLVEEYEANKTGRPGRHSIGLQLREDAGYVIGVAVNLFDQRIVLANLKRTIIDEAPLPREQVLNALTAADTVAEAVERLLKKNRLKRDRVFGIGLASAGVADPEHGVVVRAPTLGWTNVPLGREVEKKTKIPVRQTNLANAVAAAEYRFGVARKFKNFIVVHATLGYGMSIVADGRFLRGFQNQAGLLGEIPVASENRSGEEPKLDAVAGGIPIVRSWLGKHNASILKRSIDQADLEYLTREANGGNAEAILACRDAAKILGGVLTNLATALSSEAMIFFGPLFKINAYREYLETILHSAIGSNRPLDVIISAKRPVDAAYMLAISELANSGLHLESLTPR